MPVIDHKSAGGLIYHDGKFLLIYRKEKKDFTLPKGHIEEKESPEETALRETSEETGFQSLEIVAPIGKADYWWREKDGLHHKVEEDFLMKLKDKKRKILQGPEYEDIEIVWLTPEVALQKASYPSVKKQLKRAMKLISSVIRVAPPLS